MDYVNDAIVADIPPQMSPYTFEFNVTTIDDSVVEQTENFSLTVAPIQSLAISSSSISFGFATIMDDDGEY